MRRWQYGILGAVAVMGQLMLHGFGFFSAAFLTIGIGAVAAASRDF